MAWFNPISTARQRHAEAAAKFSERALAATYRPNSSSPFRHKDG